jgi:ethanolamine utilization microcompartment shell protein EutL
METEYNELVAAFKALQTDYRSIGIMNEAVYARSCHALDWAEKNQSKMVELIRTGEGMSDVWQNQQGGNR